MSWETIPVSVQSERTFNPIRDIVDKLDIRQSEEKPLIPLSIGDPTVFGNLPSHSNAIEAVREVAREDGKFNGYPPSVGYPASREAVAAKHTHDAAPLTADDVILASGCSGALDIAISAFCNPGDNILIPKPGFSLYRTLAQSYGIECRMYELQPEKSWEADLEQADSLIDDRTRVFIVNNPSNPCGSVYSKDHLKALLGFAAKHHLPVIADEIYGEIVFEGNSFFPMATLTSEVPILSVGGLAKQYLVPGWRLGWILIHDRNNLFKKIRPALTKLSQLILGPNSLVQAALPRILADTPVAFYENLKKVLQHNAQYCVERLNQIEGLRVVVPQGAMYVMTQIVLNKFKDIKDEMDFVQKLLSEEFVFVLPGSGFCAPGFFRIVFCAPEEKLKIAFDRLEVFCQNHRA